MTPLSLVGLVTALCYGEPIEPLGLSGSYEAAAETCFGPKNEVVSIRHGTLALEWLRRQRRSFKSHYLAGEGGTFSPAQNAPTSLRKGLPGPFEDKRPHEFVFYPAPLSGNFGVYALKIAELDYLREKQSVVVKLGLAQDPIQLGDFSKLFHLNGSYFHVQFTANPETWSRIERLNQELRLRLVLSSKIDGLLLYADKMWDNIVPVFEKAVVELRDCGSAFLRVEQAQSESWDPRERTHDIAFQEKQEQTEEEVKKEIAEEPLGKQTEEEPLPFTEMPKDKVFRLSIEAEDFDDVPGGASMQPFRHGFYGRERFPTHTPDQFNVSGGRIVVCEHDCVPASMTKALDPPLPPGTYRLMFSSGYFRSRFFDSIFHVTLGSETHEVCFLRHLGPDGQSWFHVPAFHLTEPTAKLTFQALQIGGGGRAETPPYPKRLIWIDRFFLTNVMEDESPERLARSREE